MKKKSIYLALLLLLFGVRAVGETIVHIDDTESWSARSMSSYVGQTVKFDVPFYICNNYSYNSGYYTIAPRRIFAPTNQAIPGSTQYSTIVSANSSGEVTLTGLSGYRRMGEILEGLTVRVNSTSSWSLVSVDKFVGNTRTDLDSGYPSVDMRGEHTLLVCALNLEYYLVENLGTGYGPDDSDEAAKQHAKIMDALTHIQADIFGFVEIEQGQTALEKLATSLSSTTGHTYSYIDDGTSASGSYTKSGYIYRTDKVEPYGDLYNNNIGVQNRKKMIGFKEKSSGERFIFSINHFKAKSGQGTGTDADQGDGQGSFNATRVLEAQSVLTSYQSKKNYYGDDDILVMGDLNAYGKEDPIRTLTDGGLVDLHRYFHADSSYSYVYRDQAGYLDHALANSTMLKQVTGMQAYHINSDEHDSFTYDKSTDKTMFRCSDHDPVLVGLRLGEGYDTHSDNSYEACTVEMVDHQLHIESAMGGYYRLYDIMGVLYAEGNVTQPDYTVDVDVPAGMYILNVYVEGSVKQLKLFIQ